VAAEPDGTRPLNPSWRAGAAEPHGDANAAEASNNAATVKAAPNATAPTKRERDRQRSDIVITPAVRAYLNAFDAYLTATKTGDTRQIRETARDKASALHTLERNAQ
jgi:hypothetical protein